jgi:hypothetical protein
MRNPNPVISSRPAAAIAVSSRRMGAELRLPGVAHASCPAMAAAPLM